MRILHTSDLHGRFGYLIRALESLDYDIWIDTGDLLPDRSYNSYADLYAKDFAEKNLMFQLRSLAEFAPRILKALRGRHGIFVPGNHDFASAASALSNLSPDENIHQLIDGSSRVELHGHVFAGFRHVTPINGMWKGELPESDIKAIAQAAFGQRPTVLCTHTPPYSILDWVRGSLFVGSKSLLSCFRNEDHNILLSLFGHVHESNGSQEADGTRFYNGACGARIIEL